MEIMKNNMKHDFMIDEILFKRKKKSASTHRKSAWKAVS